MDHKGYESEPSLLKEIAPNRSGNCSSDKESTADENEFECKVCGSKLRTEIGLHRHTMLKHNIHSRKRVSIRIS